MEVFLLVLFKLKGLEFNWLEWVFIIKVFFNLLCFVWFSLLKWIK